MSGGAGGRGNREQKKISWPMELPRDQMVN